MTRQLLKVLFISCSLLFLHSCKTQPTITYIEAPTGLNGSESSLHKSKDGTVYLSWTEIKYLSSTETNAEKSSKETHSETHSETHPEKNSKLLFSTLNDDNSWSASKTIATGNNWFVNWADFPALTSFGNGNLTAHYLEKTTGASYHYNVKLVISNDNGTTWNTAFTPHTDNTNSEHGFVSKLAMKDDTFVTVWLDGRQSAYAEKDSTIVGQMTLRSALVNKDGELLEEYLLDERICDCCQTDMAMTNEGPIVVYRDRSEEEVRDIYYVKQVNGKWTAPKPVFNDDWTIAGCPVNGPSISAKDNTVATIWFTLMNNSPKVRVAFSSNNGETFNAPIDIGDVEPIGRVDIELLEDYSALISWLDVIDGNAVIQLQRIQQDGTLSEVLTLTESSKSRSSGFPRMVVKDNKAYLSWTIIEDGDQLNLKTAVVNIDDL